MQPNKLRLELEIGAEVPHAAFEEVFCHSDNIRRETGQFSGELET